MRREAGADACVLEERTENTKQYEDNSLHETAITGAVINTRDNKEVV